MKEKKDISQIMIFYTIKIIYDRLLLYCFLLNYYTKLKNSILKWSLD